MSMKYSNWYVRDDIKYVFFTRKSLKNNDFKICFYVLIIVGSTKKNDCFIGCNRLMMPDCSIDKNNLYIGRNNNVTSFIAAISLATSQLAPGFPWRLFVSRD